MPKKRRRSIHLTERQTEMLQKEADRLGITVSELLRRIVDDWFAKEGER